MQKDNFLKQFLDLNLPDQLLWYVIGTIILVLLTGKFLSRAIATLFYKLLIKTGRKINKNAYYNLLVKPLRKFITGIVVLAALDKLYLPGPVNQFALYGKIYVRNFLETLSALILIILFIRLVLSIIEYLATILEARANLTETQGDNQLIVFFKDFFKVLLIIIGFLLVLKFGFHQNIGNLLTGLSLVGAAVALATKESLENLIASFVIFFDKPFITGDEVKVQNVTGTIEKIGLRSTRIRTLDKTYVTVPNKQMVDSIVDNQSLRTLRKIGMKLELDHQTSLLQIKNIKSEISKYLANKAFVKKFTIGFSDITKQSFVLQIDFFLAVMEDDHFLQKKDEVNFAILEILRENDISIFTEPAAGK